MVLDRHADGRPNLGSPAPGPLPPGHTSEVGSRACTGATRTGSRRRAQRWYQGKEGVGRANPPAVPCLHAPASASDEVGLDPFPHLQVCLLWAQTPRTLNRVLLTWAKAQEPLLAACLGERSL